MKRIGFVFVLMLLFRSLFAQLTTLQNNPSSLKWYQVNTPHFRVIYPKGFEEQAQRMGNTLEHIHDPEARTMGADPRKISVVLQNQSSVSNAFVTITPRHSEFYTMPPQNYNFLGTNDWLNLLASHEYRHVVQFQHSKRGLNRVFFYLFGNNTLSVLANISAPQWFWEGDAVTTETAFTHSGRGRIPYFGLVFKTNLMEGRTFNYQKQYLRSYKNNIPDHYVLGYHMISYLRKRTNDPGIWEKVTAHAWDIPIMPFTFSIGIKRESGLYVNNLYNAMTADLKKEWQHEIDQLQLTNFTTVNERKGSAYTDYMYPQALEDGSVLAMKKGIADIETFGIYKDGKEVSRFTPGFINDTGMISTAGSKVAWSEYGYDPRWGVRNYSLIKVYDFKAKAKVIVGARRARYSGVALSPDGTQVAAVRSDNSYKMAVVILNVNSGKQLYEFTTPENFFFAMPHWSDDGKQIVALKITPQGKTVSLLDIASGSIHDLLPVADENVGYPVLKNNYLFYNSPVRGIDNIYALDIASGTRYQVTTSKYGAYNPSFSADGKRILYNNQMRDGLDVVQIPYDPSTWKEYRGEQSELKPLSAYVAEQEGRSTLLDSVPKTVLPIKHYSKLKGMFNPYSWGAFVDNNLAYVNIGVMSQDILSTTTFNAGYKYDLNEHTNSFSAGLSYQGFYPIFDLSFTQGKRAVKEGDDYQLQQWYISQKNDTLVKSSLQTVKFQWDEQNVEGGIRIPLNFTHSKYSTALTVSDYIGYTHVSNFRNGVNSERYVPYIIAYDTIQQSDGKFYARQSLLSYYNFPTYVGNGNLVYNRFSVSGYHLMKRSRRDINSKWGQALFVDISSTPFGGDFSGGNYSAYGLAYFPGLAKHHSLWGYLAYQNTMMNQNDNLYYFRNKVPVPRGQSVTRLQNFVSMSANYTLPLWYPDIHLGPLINIQRIRLNAFVDYANGQTNTVQQNLSRTYTSVGGEVKFDFNIFRFLPQFDLGFRYSQGISPAVSRFDVVVGGFNF